MALATMGNWISNFVIVMVTPNGLANLNWKFFTIWAAFCISFVPIVYFLYPETARKSLEDIDVEFMERPGILRGLMSASVSVPLASNIGDERTLREPKVQVDEV